MIRQRRLPSWVRNHTITIVFHFFQEGGIACVQHSPLRKVISGSSLTCPSLPPKHRRPGSLPPTFGDHSPSDSALRARATRCHALSSVQHIPIFKLATA